jgi:hypothetical protein
VAGSLVKTGVRCNVPRLEGQAIVVLAEASAPGTAFIIEIRSSEITVQAYSGSGADYHERDFAGAGVVGFDAAEGVQVDTALAETSTLEHTAGAVGAIGSIKGSVACGKQTPGSATITITGETGQGAFDHAALAPVLVECSADAQGNEAFVSALATRGSNPVEIGLGLSSGGGHDQDHVDGGARRGRRRREDRGDAAHDSRRRRRHLRYAGLAAAERTPPPVDQRLARVQQPRQGFDVVLLRRRRLQVAGHVVDRRFQDVQLIVQRVELVSRDDELRLRQPRIERPQPRDVVLLAAGLAAERAGTTRSPAPRQFAAAPPALRPHPRFRH